MDMEERLSPGVSKPGFDKKGGVIWPDPVLRLTMFVCATPLRIAVISDTYFVHLNHEYQPPLGLAVALNVALGRREMGVSY